jgi:cysteinyl-tRNA synthetase
MSALGASGQLQSGDDRFHFGTGAADAEDRVIYNASTNELFYDADGSGAGSAQLIVRLQPGASLTATDIEVTNGAATPPPPPPTGGGTGQVLTGTSASETITGGAGDDTLQGLGSADSLVGGGGNDWLEGGTGQDRLNGGTGADRFVFKDPLASVNWDYVNDFVSGTDKLVFDDAIFASLGGPGSFAAGDERFVAAPGARYGVEPDDRLMYDTGTGKLYYDPDGSGAGSAYIVGVLQGAPALAATDITVI